MENVNDIRLPLIADPDEKYIWTLRSDPRSKAAPAYFSSNEKETIEHLKNNAARVSAIFLNPENHGTGTIQLAMNLCPGTPIFYLTNKTNLGLTDNDLGQMNIRKVIQKPVSYSELLRISHLHTELFNPEEALRISKLNSDPLHQPLNLDDYFFHSIRAHQLVTGSTSFFDIYVRHKENQYEKIAQAGERLDAAKINEYLNGGMTHLYLRVEAQQTYLHYCDHLASILIRKFGLPSTVKASFLLNHGNEILKFIRTRTVDGLAISYARRFIENMRQFVTRLPNEDLQYPLKMLRGVRDFEHEPVCVLMSLLMCKPLDMATDRNYEIVGLASLFQNVGQDEMLKHFNPADVSNLSPAEMAIYRQHPMQGARILSDIEGLDPAVIHAVEQHHERRGQTGFPLGVSIHSIAKVSEVVGICDEFTHLLQKNFSARDLKNEFQSQGLTSKFSNPVVDALMNTLLKNQE